MKIIFFDTETTGVGPDDGIIQFAAIMGEYIPETDTFYEERVINQYINTDKEIHEKAAAVHGISKDTLAHFEPIASYLPEFLCYMYKSDIVVAHNIDFDMKMLVQEMERVGKTKEKLADRKFFCTMKQSTDICKIPAVGRPGYKWPSLKELHNHCFGHDFEDAHDALADIRATMKCFFDLVKKGHLSINLDSHGEKEV